MGDDYTRGYLMALIEDAERVVSSDPLGETISPSAYTVRSREEKESKEDIYSAAASCHLCDEYRKRFVFARPVMRKNANVMFIQLCPDGDVEIADSARLELFRAWWKSSLLLDEKDWALTSLIKCPAGVFSEKSASLCSDFLRNELREYTPQHLVFLGTEISGYMLRSSRPFEELLSREFHVNGIPSYAMYSLDEYIRNRGLKRTIWQTLLYIRGRIFPEGRG